ncbi:EF-hand domain-containing protein [Sphaerisporangium flaviroseum]|uniref:EF-hand domain-containing protein n=1 Tax=Sphaerisporangium flaviroseum TaxID=509199 RepID=UPI0031F0FEE1
MSAVPADQRWAQLKRQFDTIDSDGDGFITHAEFTEHFPHLPAEAIGALDGNADGRR